MQFDDLKNKIALVTGASRQQGIGAAICKSLAAQGVHIFFSSFQAYDRTVGISHDADYPVQLAAELREMGVQAAYLDIDLSQPQAPQQLLNTVMARLGYPSILVNNAAYSTITTYDDLDVAALDAHYAVNVRAMAILSVLFARGYEGDSGRIINLTSGQDLGAMPSELAYATTKGAVSGFTRSLAHDIAHKGITVNAIDPGGTDTGWMDENLKDQIARTNPMGRVGMPHDAARLAVFLASEASQWISGQVIHSRGV